MNRVKAAGWIGFAPTNPNAPQDHKVNNFVDLLHKANKIPYPVVSFKIEESSGSYYLGGEPMCVSGSSKATYKLSDAALER